MFKKLLLFTVLINITSFGTYDAPKTGALEQMAVALIARNPDYVAYNVNDNKWDYEQGLIYNALWEVWYQTGDNKYYNYIRKNVDHFVTEDGKIKTYDFDKFRLDDIAPGRILLDLYQKTKNEKYKKAADILRKQLTEQPRTKEGGFWHKKIYPDQMWLDGLYMAEPFYAKYAEMFNEPSGFDDIAKQFILIYEHTKDPKTGLLYHGWDSSKKQKWADKETGVSPNFWGRAIGWYLMGIVDVLDYFPENHSARQKLISILNDVSESLLKYQDPKTNLWYQVIDKGNKEGNYLEASANSMFMYAFAKGARKGYLDLSYFQISKNIFNGIMNNFVKTDDDGYLSLYKTCKGAGLGGDPYRDGSYEYYINEPTRKNDFKGVGAFILGALEIERGISENKVVGLDYFFNNEWKEENGKKIRFHYIWEDKEFSGYSALGKIITNLNAKLKDITSAPSKEKLDKLSIYIIVDPDTKKETANPNYIDENSIKEITDWVNQGGVLILMSNDKDNSDFDHLNNLAEKFGIHFNGDSRNRVTNENFDMGKFDVFPDHPIFKNVKQIYIKELSTLKLNGPAKAILKDNGDIIMASAEIGKGFVFAVGDPWFYNEYIDNRRLPEDFENYKAAKNLFEWLLEKAKPVN